MSLIPSTQLHERLLRLEKSHRRWQAAAITLGLALVALFHFGQAPPKPAQAAAEVHELLIAEKIIIRDKAGKDRMVIIGHDKDKAASFELLDPSGKPRLRITGDEKSGLAAATFYDKLGRRRIALATDKSHGGRISQYDIHDRLRLDSGTFADGEASTGLYDAGGHLRLSLAADEEGAASGMAWFDGESRKRISIATSKDGSAHIQHTDPSGRLRISHSTLQAAMHAGSSYFDQEGVLRLSLGTFDTGRAAFQLADPQGTMRMETVSTKDGPVFVRFMDYDDTGKVKEIKRLP